jgi:uncharacterized membrane protein
MRRITIIIVGVVIYVGEIILIMILLSSISSFFPESVVPFLPDSSNYFLVAILYLIRLIALLIAILLLRREVRHARKDWANPKGFWYFKKEEKLLDVTGDTQLPGSFT